MSFLEWVSTTNGTIIGLVIIVLLGAPVYVWWRKNKIKEIRK